jgi:hypothetical protein
MKITKEEPTIDKAIIDLLSRTSAGSKSTWKPLLKTAKISAATHLERVPIINICNCSHTSRSYMLENGQRPGALTPSGHSQKYVKQLRNQINWLK